MPSQNNKFFALPVAPTVPVIELVSRRKYADIKVDAIFMSDKAQHILEESFDVLANQLFEAVTASLKGRPEAKRMSFHGNGIYWSFRNIPLDVVTPLIRVISQVFCEHLARNSEPIPVSAPVAYY